MNLIRLLALFASCSLLPAFACGGEPPATAETETTAAPFSVVPDGLPGGGHFCCWRSGVWSTIVNPPNCPAPSIALTPSNLASHCSCAPFQLWC
jgi:hypothetical protein